MIIPSKIITSCGSNGDWYTNYTEISNADVAILAIFHLHDQKIINNDRFKAYCKQYNDKSLIRRVNTYHCKINDTWYNDDSTFTAILDSYNEKCQRVDFSVDKMLTYLNKLFNKNRNFCVDHLFFNYVNPVLWNLASYSVNELFKSFDFGTSYRTYDEVERTGDLSFGYCCSDCDGCLGEYKQRRYESLLGYDYQSKLINELKTKLNGFKTDSGRKNPKNLLKV
jgi:hypothetical protein